jgi:hypothetical protein
MTSLASLMIFAGILTSRSLVDPNPIAVDESRNPQQVFAATMDGASRAGWSIQPRDAHTFLATTVRGPHAATVVVTVDVGQVSFKYMSSSNLDYKTKDGEQTIHKAYMEWSGFLASSIRTRLGSLCPDMTQLLDPSYAGLVNASLVERVPAAESFSRELPVTSSSGASTGYLVREYDAYLNGADQDCQPVSAVFFNDKFVSVMQVKAEPAALIAYSDVLNYLVSQKAISFSDAEMERMSLKVDIVNPLDLPRREELLRFVEWQAQRYDRKETSLKEYQYLLAQKEAEVQERQAAIDQKEKELGLLKRQQAIDSQSLEVQREQLSAQRAAAIGIALANLSQSLAYRPTFNSGVRCTSRAYGNTVYTDCR